MTSVQSQYTAAYESLSFISSTNSSTYFIPRFSRQPFGNITILRPPSTSSCPYYHSRYSHLDNSQNNAGVAVSSTNLDPNDVDQVRTRKLQCLQLDLDRTLAIAADPDNRRCVDHQVKNIKFLIDHYKAGGVPPAPGDARWVKDGQFVDTAGRPFPEPFDPNSYTADPGIVMQY